MEDGQSGEPEQRRNECSDLDAIMDGDGLDDPLGGCVAITGTWVVLVCVGPHQAGLACSSCMAGQTPAT